MEKQSKREKEREGERKPDMKMVEKKIDSMEWWWWLDGVCVISVRVIL